MYSNAQRPSEIIARQRKVIEEQEGIIVVLKAALAAAGGEPASMFQPWMRKLSPQQQALLGVLYSRYPNPVSKFELLELIPGSDHVQDRQVNLVSVQVHHLRRKLGQEAIENVRGLGYRLGRGLYEVMAEKGTSS